MNKQKGISQIAVMIIMLILAIALPITTRLVQQVQENRGKAAEVIEQTNCTASEQGNNKCVGSSVYTCNTYPEAGPTSYTFVWQLVKNCSVNDNQVCQNGKCIATPCAGGKGVCTKSYATMAPGIACSAVAGGITTGDTCPTAGYVCCAPAPATPPTCTEANWDYTLSPTTCSSTGKQTKTWTKVGTCTGGVSHPATEIVNCTCISQGGACITSASQVTSGLVCTGSSAGSNNGTINLNFTCSLGKACCIPNKTIACTSYTVGPWGACVGGTQVRNVTGIPSGCTGGTVTKPSTSGPCTTITPTVVPTAVPTIKPTAVPTTKPITVVPTTAPTLIPTTRPIATVTPTPAPGYVAPKLNLVFTVSGVKSVNPCFGDLTFKVNVAKDGQVGITRDIAAVAIDQFNVNGDQVFKVTGFTLDNTYALTDKIKVFVSGKKTLATMYGKDDQVSGFGALNQSQILVSSLVSGDYLNFIDYPVLNGDVGQNGQLGAQDGVVNGIDFSYMRTQWGRTCNNGENLEADLNGDCRVDTFDLQILKNAMAEQYAQKTF